MLSKTRAAKRPETLTAKIRPALLPEDIESIRVARIGFLNGDRMPILLLRSSSDFDDPRNYLRGFSK